MEVMEGEEDVNHTLLKWKRRCLPRKRRTLKSKLNVFGRNEEATYEEEVVDEMEGEEDVSLTLNGRAGIAQRNKER